MRKWVFVPVIIILAIFQVTILDYFKIFGSRPDLLLIAAISLSKSWQLRWAISLSVFAGILKDIFGVGIFGINTLLLSLWSFITVKASKEISLDNKLVFALFLFIIAVLNNVALTITSIFLNKIFIPIGVFLRIAFLDSLYTVVLSFVILKIIVPIIPPRRWKQVD